MVETTGNVASHTAKAAAEDGLAQAFTYEADERNSSEWRAWGVLASTSTVRPMMCVSDGIELGSMETLAAEFP